MTDVEDLLSTTWMADHTRLLVQSHTRLTGRPLLVGAADVEPAELARRLYDAPFVVLSHDLAGDPRFTYANRTAQTLFERPWHELVGMPSRLSAEAAHRDARAAMLDEVARTGFSDRYTGVRVSASGRRFMIRDATVWNLVDEAGVVVGQAATFARWEPL